MPVTQVPREPVTILGPDGEPVGAFRLETVEALDNGPGGLTVVLHSGVLTFQQLAPEHWRELHALWMEAHSPDSVPVSPARAPAVGRAAVCLVCGRPDCAVPGHGPGLDRLGVVLRTPCSAS